MEKKERGESRLAGGKKLRRHDLARLCIRELARMDVEPISLRSRDSVQLEGIRGIREEAIVHWQVGSNEGGKIESFALPAPPYPPRQPLNLWRRDNVDAAFCMLDCRPGYIHSCPLLCSALSLAHSAILLLANLIGVRPPFPAGSQAANSPLLIPSPHLPLLSPRPPRSPLQPPPPFISLYGVCRSTMPHDCTTSP
ncbi:hypothetical protein WH47_04560 [Habropoda laboriosa]|uniref:Uncharacterized protein n=1 Tax=Habropoda laboriosa TaxID=597456 RepID=A0A0L7R2H3_9HYME|nr:hypothetical protein WH47_04560 [Habropoda laboriosa]